MELLTPHWSDYELIDSGGYEKLERFGAYVLARPEPQACWNKSLDEAGWQHLAHVRFLREKGNTDPESEKGRWNFYKKMPESWFVSYSYQTMKLKFRMGLTSFKHVGLFPEQAENWNFIHNIIPQSKKEQPRVLNLFAYTGGASLAAKASGADVVHVDSVKPVINWARENMDISGLNGIRWVVEDAMKFVRREVRRGSRYTGIIMDPPAYGRGPDGEKWILSESINELVALCAELLEPTNSFFIINLYSMGFSALVADNLVNAYFPKIKSKQYGELFLPDRSGNRLPLGIFLRFST